MGNNKIRVFYTNADRFLNKRNLLLAQIAGNTPPDVISICEILPKAPNAVVDLSLIALPDYYCYLNFDPNNYIPTSSNIRGVGIFVHHKFQASQVTFNSSHFEDHVWVNVKLQGSDSLLVGCIYRSPSGNIDSSTASLCDLFTSLDNYTHLLICGDFNYKEISWSDLSGTTNNHHIEPFLDIFDDLFLSQHITEPTRFRQEEIPNLLDLVFTNEQDMINNLLYLPPLGSSDHICIEFDLICYPEPRKSVNLKYNIRAANIELMKQALGDVDWVSTLHTLDANGAWILFKTIFQDIIDKYVPTYKQRERKSLYSNSEVFSLMKHKNKLWKKYLSTCSPTDLSNFKKVNNQLRNLTRNLKKLMKNN